MRSRPLVCSDRGQLAVALARSVPDRSDDRRQASRRPALRGRVGGCWKGAALPSPTEFRAERLGVAGRDGEDMGDRVGPAFARAL